MHPRISLVLAILLTATPTLGQGRGKAPRSKTERVSYALGYSLGRDLKFAETQVELDFLMQGLAEGLQGREGAVSEQEVQKLLAENEQEAVARVAARNKAEGDRYLAANKKKDGVQVTKSGLQYKVLKQGKGPTPKLSDNVSVLYRGTFISGDEFDGTEPNRPFITQVNGVIAGWVEALQMMPKGSKWQLAIPAELAYGPNGNPPTIAPNTVLLFDLELVEVNPPLPKRGPTVEEQ